MYAGYVYGLTTSRPPCVVPMLPTSPRPPCAVPMLPTSPRPPPHPQTSVLKIHVFDARKFRYGEWAGFLGMTIVPASALFDSSSLGEGATAVISFRLKKHHPDDTVTGTILVKVRTLHHSWPLADVTPPRSGSASAGHGRSPLAPSPTRTATAAGSTSSPTAARTARSAESTPQSTGFAGCASTPAISVPARALSRAGSVGRDSPLLSTSPGDGWQVLPQQYVVARQQPLLPPTPATPRGVLGAGEDVTVLVVWDAGPGVTGPATGISYTLAVLNEQDVYQDIYTGA